MRSLGQREKNGTFSRANKQRESGIRFFDDSDVYASINESGIDTDFNLDVAGNWTGNSYYAEGWYHNHTATPLSFAVQDTFYNLT
ncbi:MAG: hypothetical protein KJ717_05505, partial [Proteobacteria bacterium]|nr:hypothetical protein [Pseudomonadota bacterium]